MKMLETHPIKQRFHTSLFLFRRDLRLEDNTGLIFALQASKIVIPAFIFTPEQIDHNPYRSDHCLKFMLESLIDLDEQLNNKGSSLFFFKGKPEDITQKCISLLRIEAVIVNRDYTPYSLQRDNKLEQICQSNGIHFYSFDDALLHSPENTLKSNGTPYKVFTPYFRSVVKQTVLPPVHNSHANYFRGTISFAEDKSLLSKILPRSLKNSLAGGRNEALKILKGLSAFTKYDDLKNQPAENYSTHLSPYLKFTVCSPREVYAAICHYLHPQHELLRALYWRDFFTMIAFFFPHVFTGAFHPKFDKINWQNNHQSFLRWCQGTTGFPIVDAGMREMNETGFMHNRVRMIVASFLVKDLHIDWRWGEKYFAQTLIDYDPCVNNGNWQWAASTGCDAQPYFRIFNPWSQQKKFDPECLYIKKWIKELHEVPSHIILKWHEEKYHAECISYPPPIINHEAATKVALQAYKELTTA